MVCAQNIGFVMLVELHTVFSVEIHRNSPRP